MNREIKFRAWDGEMMVWNGLYVENGHLVLPNETTVRDTAKTLVWMQFTGLLDKNGKEIFEGDVVSLVYEDLPALNITGEIIWDTDFACFRIKGDNITDWVRMQGCYEVIGNVFENPELIEKSV